MSVFQLVSPYEPAGDQPAAIDALVRGVEEGKPHQTLLGVTGSGKTFTMANVVAGAASAPTLVLSHNKTLAAQLYSRVQAILPRTTRSEYFVSYLRLLPAGGLHSAQRDTYIEKDSSSTNEEIERLRLSATSSLLTPEATRWWWPASRASTASARRTTTRS